MEIFERITTNAAMKHKMTTTNKMPNLPMTMVEPVLILTSVPMTSITVNPIILVITQKVLSLVFAEQDTAEMESHVPTSMNALLDLIAGTLTRSVVTRLVHVIVSARMYGNLTMMAILIPSALMSTNMMPSQI